LAETVENLSDQSISNYLEPVAGPSLSAEDPCHNAHTQDCKLKASLISKVFLLSLILE
jgi:hypothetical protein